MVLPIVVVYSHGFRGGFDGDLIEPERARACFPGPKQALYQIVAPQAREPRVLEASAIGHKGSNHYLLNPFAYPRDFARKWGHTGHLYTRDKSRFFSSIKKRGRLGDGATPRHIQPASASTRNASV
jgi:hypothetical protein